MNLVFKKLNKVLLKVFIGIILLIILFFVNGYNNKNNKFDCLSLVPNNPYTKEKESAEFTGFEWSKVDRDLRESKDCEAYNESFIVGCMEYIKQEIFYNKCFGNELEVKKYEAIKPILLFCKEDDKIDGYCFSGR